MAAKYRSRKTEVNGMTFDSAAEARAYLALKARQAAGEITDLQTQVAFELAPSVRIQGRKRPPLRYVADFSYIEGGKLVVADAKGVITEGYRIKRHLMAAVHGVEIREIRALKRPPAMRAAKARP